MPQYRVLNGIRCRIASSLDGIDVPTAAAKKAKQDLISVVVSALMAKHGISQPAAEQMAESLQPSTLQEILNAPTSAQPAPPAKPSSSWATPDAPRTNASGVPKPIDQAEVIRAKDNGKPLRKALLERKDQ